MAWMAWTEQEIEWLLANYTGSNVVECSLELGRSPDAIQCKMKRLAGAQKPKADEEETNAQHSNNKEPYVQSRSRRSEHIETATAGPDYDELVRQVRDQAFEIGRMRQQLAWAQKGIAEKRTGGTVTIRESDHHYGDKNHYLQSCAEAQGKTLQIIEQYEPERIQIVTLDDWIAGTGIYRNQDLDSTTSSVSEQCQVGAVKMRDRLRGIRAITDAPITIHALDGNHNYSHGHSMMPMLFMMARDLCSDIPDVNWVQHHQYALVNIAHDGIHNVLFCHGFGHSNLSPQSSAFVNAVKDKIILVQHDLLPDERIRRVCSGHTHWLDTGSQRILGLNFDNTGGWQRNTRVKIGSNQRPVGMICYVSLPGMEHEILEPIRIEPEYDTLRAEIESPSLEGLNLADTADCLSHYFEIREQRGDIGKSGIGGTHAGGRW